MTIKTLFWILSTGCLTSCSSDNKQDTDTKTASRNFKTLDTIISFAGSWVSENHYSSILKYRSPKKAQDGSLFIKIPDKTLKETMMILNFHEGGPPLTILKNGNSYETWEIQEGNMIQKLDEIQVLSTEKIRIGAKTFIKVISVPETNAEVILQDLLFKGRYLLNGDKTVEFLANGQIKGLGTFQTYAPHCDYYDSGMQVDQLALGSSNTQPVDFGFTFEKDTLKIYKLKCLTYDSIEKKCYDVELGTLEFSLVKVN